MEVPEKGFPGRSMSEYLHHVPGRLRVRSAGLKRNPPAARRVQAALAEVKGVLEVEVSTLTGSIKVVYAPDCVRPGDLVTALGARGLVAAERLPAVEPGAVVGVLEHTAERAARAVAAIAVEALLKRSLGAALAALV